MEMNLILLLIGLCSIALASANNITTTSRPKSQPTSKSGSVIKTLAKKVSYNQVHPLEVFIILYLTLLC